MDAALPGSTIANESPPRPRLQALAQRGYGLVPRGWTSTLGGLARLLPPLRRYPARLRDGRTLVVDLRQPMCMLPFLRGDIPMEPGTAKLIRWLLKEGDVCVDVGANVGFYASLAAEMVGPTGQVLAFEPMPEALHVLRENARRHPQIFVHATAVSDRDGSARLIVAVSGDRSSLRSGYAKKIKREEDVPLTTLDAALTQLDRLDLVKIDVEGAELDVLRGARQVLQRHQPVVYLEALPKTLDQAGSTLADFRACLEPLGYTVRWINHKANTLADLASDTRSNYLIAIPPRFANRFSPSTDANG